MAQVQISDVVVPAEFTAYTVENSLVSTALLQSGVVAKNGLIEEQLQAGAQSFNVPFWADTNRPQVLFASSSRGQTFSQSVLN